MWELIAIGYGGSARHWSGSSTLNELKSKSLELAMLKDDGYHLFIIMYNNVVVARGTMKREITWDR